MVNMGVLRGLIVPFISFFKSGSPTNDYPANPSPIDGTKSINLPFSLDEQITHKKIFSEGEIKKKKVRTPLYSIINHHMKALLNSLTLNGHTLGFHPQI